MKNCHDEQLFIWSSKSKRTNGRIESTGEEFPKGYGIDFRQEYYMMMIIYEYVDTELIDNSGSKIFKMIFQWIRKAYISMHVSTFRPKEALKTAKAESL